MDMMPTFEIQAEALFIVWLCARHLMQCHKLVAKFVGNMSIDGGALRRLRRKRRLIINHLMDLQRVQRQIASGGRRWMLPRIRKLWFEQEVMQVIGVQITFLSYEQGAVSCSLWLVDFW